MRQYKIEKLIIGLGNPTTEYADTRHNIGFMVVTSFANQFKHKWHTISRLLKQTEVEVTNKRIVLSLPLTFMNNSGQAVKWLLQEYSISASQILVVVDEYNFPLGKIHLKKVNSDGGHNGIASIINEIECNDFYILRCGIDRNFQHGQMPDYVLSPFNDNELPQRDQMIANAADAIKYFINNDEQKAMSLINTNNN